MGEPHEIIRVKDQRLKAAGRNKAAGGDSGSNKKRAELPKGAREQAQQATKQNQMVMVLSGNGKRTWVRVRDLDDVGRAARGKISRD